MLVVLDFYNGSYRLISDITFVYFTILWIFFFCLKLCNKVVLINFLLECSEDGRLSCGYSSFRGKRASMEDFYDVKMSKIDGKTVCLFGIFDGCVFFPHLVIFVILRAGLHNNYDLSL